MEWRVLGLEERNAYMNMGIDHAVLDGVISGSSPPTIRFYTWKPSAISIGRFQGMADEVNIERCRELGVHCVRRITGGGAVYHDDNGELTYSIIAPESAFPNGILESYREICGYVIAGLARLGISSEFSPINDITVNGKKISGNAQTRKGRAILQHGTILYRLNLPTMFSLLKISREKLSDKMIQDADERVTCVSRSSNATIDELYSAMLDGFTAGKKYKMGSLSSTELSKANNLASSLYSTHEWNFMK